MPTAAAAPRCSDAGQAVPFAGLLVLLAVSTIVVIGHIGRLVSDAATARAAADAAALAGAASGAEQARALAEANGAALVRYRERPWDVEVTVRVGQAEATARAARGAPPGAPSRRSAPALGT